MKYLIIVFIKYIHDEINYLFYHRYTSVLHTRHIRYSILHRRIDYIML